MNSMCSHERLERALAGLLNADDESTLHLHLDECELCSAEMERLAGGERASQEIASMLIPDDLDDALPLREECSAADFVVEHLEPSDDAAVLGRLGSYDVLDVIGRGGMGVVLKGYDRELKRFVAIKALAPHLAHSALARKRFAREAQAAAAVVNLHVIAIHQVQPNGQLPFLVMPLLTGESLAQRMTARGTLELKEILRIGMQAAEGLAAAHGQGLIHRDIKPANILLEKGVERAVLTDFGLARAADDVSMTRWGIIAGTPEYMSPEQARGEALDGRSDLFSLGCVMYEMATGASPFRADSTMATLRRIVDEKPVAMASHSPELPPWFIGIVERLLSKDPAQRFASASEVSELLEQCLSHLQQPTRVSLPKGAKPSAVRRRGRPPLTVWLVAAAAAVALMLAGILVVLELNKGQLTIECSADGVPVRILQADTVVKSLTVTRAGATVRVAAGNYVVEIDGTTDGIIVQDGVVSLRRGGVETVRIVNKPAATSMASQFPGMTESIADAILDWVDDDNDQRPFGAEAETYLQSKSLHSPPNRPLKHINELFGCRGITPELLYGADFNRNGIIDAGEDDSVVPALGWAGLIRAKQAESATGQGKTLSEVDQVLLALGQADREKAVGAKPTDRTKSADNVRQILLAMHKYSTEHHRLPPAVIYGKDGTGNVPHSWRVELLKYLENGAALYNQYQFDEPWHSVANQKVLAQMPAIYRHPSEDSKSNCSAYYVVEGGANDASLPTAFSNKNGIRFRDILDGSSYTIAVVETNLVVPWTKPEDILYDPEHNLPAFGGFYGEGFHVGTCDGSVKFLPGSISEKLLRAYLSPAGREQVPPMEDAAQADRRSTANVTRYALKNVKAMDAAHLIGKSLPNLSLPGGSVDIVAYENTNSITVRGDDATQRIILAQLKLLDAETTEVPHADTDKSADNASASARPLPDMDGVYWSDRNEDHWVTGMKVVQWPTAVNRKLVVEFLLRNESPDTREMDVNVHCGKKTSLSLSEGNQASVDIKETRREKLIAAPNAVLAFKEGRAEISFAGLETGEYTLRFHPVIYIPGGDGIGHGVPFDLALPVTFDASYASLPIHWGKPVAGLRLGAMFQDARQGEVKRFALRDQARIQLFVQNVSPQEIECGFDRPYHGGGWETHITDSAGQQMEGNWNLDQVGITIQPLPLWARLAPGEIQPISGELPKFRVGNEDEGSTPNLKHAHFMIVQQTPGELRTVPPYDYVLPAGEYSARFSATLRKFSSPDVTFTVHSAVIPFQVGVGKSTS